MKFIDLNVKKISGAISTDDIIPGIYKHKFTNPDELKNHVFENKFPGFVKQFSKNTVLCSDAIFGIGSSREQAVSSLLAAGVCVVVAPCFGRIFFRNALNLGLIAIELDLTKIVLENELISIDLTQGLVYLKNKTIQFQKLPSELIYILQVGGLLKSIS